MQHVEQRELKAVFNSRDFLERQRRVIELPIGDAIAHDPVDRFLQIFSPDLPQRSGGCFNSVGE